MMIEDGTGTGLKVKVDSLNRLHNFSVVRSEETDAAVNARSYVIESGLITLTSPNKSAVFYLKNTELVRLFIDVFIIYAGLSTGGTVGDSSIVEILKNPTAGTIVSGAVNVDIESNRNFSSISPLNADAFKGAEANTFTDGNTHLIAGFSPDTDEFKSGIILSNGNSVGVNVTPPASNTTMAVSIGVICHTEEIVF